MGVFTAGTPPLAAPPRNPRKAAGPRSIELRRGGDGVEGAAVMAMRIMAGMQGRALVGHVCGLTGSVAAE
jgi:hypothetical protein